MKNDEGQARCRCTPPPSLGTAGGERVVNEDRICIYIALPSSPLPSHLTSPTNYFRSHKQSHDLKGEFKLFASFTCPRLSLSLSLPTNPPSSSLRPPRPSIHPPLLSLSLSLPLVARHPWCCCRCPSGKIPGCEPALETH